MDKGKRAEYKGKCLKDINLNPKIEFAFKEKEEENDPDDPEKDEDEQNSEHSGQVPL